ncbi:MAG TPA: hypothetical protein VNS02_00485 [Rhizobiaceae bacterium]|nr:hypothetical protein [Rhizobiaceae bacterium]
MVVEAQPSQPFTAARRAEIERLVADTRRLRGDLRISVAQTDDGLGIHIAPMRNYFAAGFLALWLCGWAAGEYFAIGQVMHGGITGLFLLIWLVPWTLAGASVLWLILWQVFGVERLFFTAGALVREWGLFGLGRRRVVQGDEIHSVTIQGGTGNDLLGMGTIKVATAGRTLRIGNGLASYEAELVAELIRQAASGQGVAMPAEGAEAG